WGAAAPGPAAAALGALLGQPPGPAQGVEIALQRPAPLAHPRVAPARGAAQGPVVPLRLGQPGLELGHPAVQPALLGRGLLPTRPDRRRRPGELPVPSLDT